MSCSEECAVEIAEAKEFAYFAGLSKGSEVGRRAERKRIETELINNKRRFTEYLADGRLVCFSYLLIDLLKEIDEDNK
jgi:hypothetical protein